MAALIEAVESEIEAEAAATAAPEIDIPLASPETAPYTAADAQKDFAWVWKRERNQISRPGKRRLMKVREWLQKEVLNDELEDIL